MPKNIRKIFAICFAASCLTGCYAEGYSYLLTSGDKQHFLSLAGCESEAMSKYSDGGPKYSGYICKQKLFFITLEQRDYNDGKPISAVQ